MLHALADAIKHVFPEKQEVDDLVQWYFPFKMSHQINIVLKS